MLAVHQRLCNLQRFLMLPSTEAGQTLTPHLHTVPFLIHVNRTASCSDCVACLFALHRGNARELSSILRNISAFVLHSCLLVCLYATA